MYNELKGPDISFLLTAKGKDPAAQIFFSFSAKVGAVFGICTLKFCVRFFLLLFWICVGAGFSWERSDVIYFLAPIRIQQYLNVTGDSCGKKQIN